MVIKHPKALRTTINTQSKKCSYNNLVKNKTSSIIKLHYSPSKYNLSNKDKIKPKQPMIKDKKEGKEETHEDKLG